jgi:2,6-dihydroxypseudooxynicotine hydrolase
VSYTIIRRLPIERILQCLYSLVMALDTSSFSAYVRSLELTGPINTRPGRLVDGPPAPIVELALQLGLGQLLLDTPRTRLLFENLGLNPRLLKTAGQRLRTRAMWLPVMQELAAPHISAAEASLVRGERETAAQRVKAALTLLYIALSGDGYYFFTPMCERGRLLPLMRRLYRLLRAVLGARTETLVVRHALGKTRGLLQLPPGSRAAPPKSVPALLAFHPLGSDKESFDSFLVHFRDAGYATFCIDLPAHGESFDGPRLRPDAEMVGVAALDALARHPAIDSTRLGVMGGSLGGFFAQRTAAASPHVKACLAYASPFDLSSGMESVLPGVADCFAWAVGAQNEAQGYAAARQFHLRDVLDKIDCPVCVIHGTQDHICDFTASYQIASRLRAPVTVHPLVGADHEASNPITAEFAGPGIAWLQQNL